MNFSLDSITSVVNGLEGHYKWYVIGGVILFMAFTIHRVIFKSLKWIFIVVGIVIIALAFLWQFGFLDSSWLPQ